MTTAAEVVTQAISASAADPHAHAHAIAQAQKAGIVVAVYGATPQEAAQAKVTYNTDDPYALDGKYAAEQAVAQHNGQPFQAIAITSNAAPATAIMQAALKSELATAWTRGWAGR